MTTKAASKFNVNLAATYENWGYSGMTVRLANTIRGENRFSIISARGPIAFGTREDLVKFAEWMLWNIA